MRQCSLHDHVPFTDHLGLTSRVPPQEVVAMSGIYVDDFLTAGPRSEFLLSPFFQNVENVGSTVSDDGC